MGLAAMFAQLSLISAKNVTNTPPQLARVLQPKVCSNHGFHNKMFHVQNEHCLRKQSFLLARPSYGTSFQLPRLLVVSPHGQFRGTCEQVPGQQCSVIVSQQMFRHTHKVGHFLCLERAFIKIEKRIKRKELNKRTQIRLVEVSDEEKKR